MGTRNLMLASFLKSRRRRVTPEQAGVPPTAHRRVPGLRREEVAWAADIGITWYTWLEQGRPIKIAGKTLDRIAAVLQLDSSENEYLHKLALTHDDAAIPWRHSVAHGVRTLVEGYTAGYAALITPCWEILAWNEPYGALLGLETGDSAIDRNGLWIMFTRDRARRAFPNWCGIAQQMVAIFRLQYVDYIANAEFEEIINALTRRSAEFSAMWSDGNVLSPMRLDVSEIRDPESARVRRFETVNVAAPDSAGQVLVFHVPAAMR